MVNKTERIRGKNSKFFAFSYPDWFLPYKLKWKPLFPAGFLNHTRSVKLGMVCFHMVCSLLNVLAHHLWMQFSKSTLLFVFMLSMLSEHVIGKIDNIIYSVGWNFGIPRESVLVSHIGIIMLIPLHNLSSSWLVEHIKSNEVILNRFNFFESYDLILQSYSFAYLLKS